MNVTLDAFRALSKGRPVTAEDLPTDLARIRNPFASLKSLFGFLKNRSDFRKIPGDIARRLLEPRFLTRNLPHLAVSFSIPRSKMTAHATKVVKAYVAYCAEEGKQVPDVSHYPFINESNEPIQETSYFALWQLTRKNGDYKVGGMKRVAGTWVYDTSVKGRTANGRKYVITTAEPKVTITENGKLELTFRYQSRPNRSTTGQSHVGRIIMSTTDLKRILSNVPKAILHGDMQLQCGCPDFQYRSHYLLSRIGAAPRPIGLGNNPPLKTNPEGRMYFCKHLSAVSPKLHMMSHALRKAIGAAIKGVLTSPAVPTDTSPEIKPGADIESDPE